MTDRTWPSREEWQAKAEYAARTACTAEERLPADARWSSPEEDAEAQQLAVSAAKALRPLLTAEIARLRELLPDRPVKATNVRIGWMLALPEDRYALAQDLAAVEGIRTRVARSARDGDWQHIAWQLGRLLKGYPTLRLGDELLDASERMQAIARVVDARRSEAARELEDEAVAREIARRATDEGWAKELQRRARVEQPRVILHH